MPFRRIAPGRAAWLCILFAGVCSISSASAAEASATYQPSTVETLVTRALEQQGCKKALQILRLASPEPRHVLWQARAFHQCGKLIDAAQAYWEVLSAPQYFTAEELAEARQGLQEKRPVQKELSAPPLASKLGSGSPPYVGQRVGGTLLMLLGVGLGVGGGFVSVNSQKVGCSSGSSGLFGGLDCIIGSAGIAGGALMIVTGAAAFIGGGVLALLPRSPQGGRGQALLEGSPPRLHLAPFVTPRDGGIVLFGRF